MKILVVNNVAPFVWGGAEALADHLVANLQRTGHQAELLKIPFEWEPADRIPSQMVLARWLELREADRVIALKFPAYLVRHPMKTLWVLHQYRQAYDLFESGHSNLPSGDDGELLRNFIAAADNEAFSESRSVFVNSPITRDRMFRFNDFESEVLLPPVNDPELFNGDEPEGYIFVGGRINSMKRQTLIVRAAALHAQTRLIIAGPPDSYADQLELEELVEELGIENRVTLDIRMLDRSEYADYMNKAQAAVYAPLDEDSLGYVAMEAATAARPLITTTDSGGILGLVRNGETGWVAEPTPEDLADVFESVYASESRCKNLGNAARVAWNSMDVTWDVTLEKLLT